MKDLLKLVFLCFVSLLIFACDNGDKGPGPISEIKLKGQNSITLSEGETVDLRDYFTLTPASASFEDVTFTVERPAFAKIENGYTLVYVSAGSTTVKATAREADVSSPELSVVCELPPIGIVVNKNTIYTFVGILFDLTPVFSLDYTKPTDIILEYEVEDNSVATTGIVDGKPVLIGVSEGDTKLYAFFTDARDEVVRSAPVAVTVEAGGSGIVVNQSVINVGLYSTYDLPPVFTAPAGVTLSYEVEDAAIALLVTIQDPPRLVGMAVGQTLLYAFYTDDEGEIVKSEAVTVIVE